MPNAKWFFEIGYLENLDSARFLFYYQVLWTRIPHLQTIYSTDSQMDYFTSLLIEESKCSLH